MSHNTEWSRDAHRWLDGETTEPPAAERTRVEAFAEAMDVYARDLVLPGPEVDRAVMEVIRTGRTRGRRSAWQWMIQPKLFQVRPVLAAAALLVIAIGLATELVPRPPAAAPATASQPAVQPLPPFRAPTVLVRFAVAAPDAQRVTLAGSFNHWDSQSIPLKRSASTGLWVATVPLRPGRYEYMFVVDGQRWIPDPAAHALVDDGFGQRNSVIVVGPRGVVTEE